MIVGKNTEPVKFSTYLLTKRKFTDFRLVFASSWSSRRCTRASPSGVGCAPGARTIQYTYAGPPGDVPVRLGHVRPVRPQRASGGRRAGEEGRQAARLERHRDPGPGQPRPRRGQRQAVVDWRDPEPDRIKEGPIGLQLHSNKVPQEVQFKDLKLETFPRINS